MCVTSIHIQFDSMQFSGFLRLIRRSLFGEIFIFFERKQEFVGYHFITANGHSFIFIYINIIHRCISVNVFDLCIQVHFLMFQFCFSLLHIIPVIWREEREQRRKNWMIICILGEKITYLNMLYKMWNNIFSACIPE